MNSVHPYSHLETPTLSINHCSDLSCPHPSCWASRKLYRRNAYLLMLKGEPATEEVHHKEKPPEKHRGSHREIPTQKVHNIVDELFRSASESDDWQSTARGISAGQFSIKHMPTPMSSLSRNASKLHQSDGLELEADEEAEDAAGKMPIRKPVGHVYMEDMFQQSNPHSVYHSREYVWVPNPNKKPKAAVRRSEQDSVGKVNINEELGNYLHEDTYNQRQAALQERAVERSHLSTARVQRFFKSCHQASSTKHVDLFKLPSELLSEVLRNVDEGEPMTDESLAKMIAEAETPTGGAKDEQHQHQHQHQHRRRDFQQHVLRQRRAQLHQSDAGRNLREPHKHTARAPIFLLDESAAGAEAAVNRPPQRLPPIGAGGGGSRAAAATVAGQFARRAPAAATDGAAGSSRQRCHLMLGPVVAAADDNGGAGGSVGSTDRRTARSARAADNNDAGSLDVECRSDRSTLLDEVLPSRAPRTMDSGLVALLAMNRPSYDLDDPWADSVGGPHPTTRNQSTLTTTGSADASAPEPPSAPPASAAGADGLNDEAGVHLSLTTPVPGVEEADGNGGNDEAEEEDRASLLLAPSNTGRGNSPGPPPPSPDVVEAAAASSTSSSSTATMPTMTTTQTVVGGRPVSPPAPAARRAAAPASSKAKSAVSSAQMPRLDEDEEDEED